MCGMCSALATDRVEQRRQRRQALAQLKASSASWSTLQHIQLLCNSYKAAQQKLWAGQKHAVQVRLLCCLSVMNSHWEATNMKLL